MQLQVEVELGNQLTKLAIKEIQLLPTVEGEEWPIPEKEEAPVEIKPTEEIAEPFEENKEVSDKDENIEVAPAEPVTPIKDKGPVEVEWEIETPEKIEEPKKEKKNPIKPADDEDDQMTLF